MDSFQVDQFGLVTTESFITDFQNRIERRHPGSDEKYVPGTSDSERDPKKRVIVKAQRYCDGATDTLNKIALSIIDRQFHEFGTYLKGYDFENNNQMKTRDLYHLLEKLFSNAVGQGDILDVCSYLD